MAETVSVDPDHGDAGLLLRASSSGALGARVQTCTWIAFAFATPRELSATLHSPPVQTLQSCTERDAFSHEKNSDLTQHSLRVVSTVV